MLGDSLVTLATAAVLVLVGFGICRLTHDHEDRPPTYIVLLPGSTRRPAHPSMQRSRRQWRAAHPTRQRPQPPLRVLPGGANQPRRHFDFEENN